MSELVSDISNSPELGVDHLVELLCANFLSTLQIPNQPGIEITWAGAHRHPGCRGEKHACVHRFAATHRRPVFLVSEVQLQ
jgi:hypothetical protein